MAVAWMVARVELARRWVGLGVIGLLVAVVTAVLLTALTGALRTSSSVDRFRTQSLASDVAYQADTPEGAEDMLAAVRSLDVVQTATQRHLVNAWLVDGAVPDIAVLSDPADIYGKGIDRPLILAGRMPAVDAADEILLNEMAAQATGLGPGDRIRAASWSEDDLYALFTPSGDFPGFNGPPLDLEVVGVGRMPEELPGDVRRTAPFAIASPAFLAAHPGIGAWPPAVVVRLRSGADLSEVGPAASAAVASLGADQTSPPDPPVVVPGTTAAALYLDTARATVTSLAWGLVVFAVASLLAGALAITQAVQRQLAGSSIPSSVLGALGLTRSGIAMARIGPVVVVGAIGALFGVWGAIALSPLLPVGLARRAEVDPGVWIVPWTTATATIVLLTTLTLGSFTLARRALATSRTRRRRSTALTGLAWRAGATPTLVTGIRFAGDGGGGRGAVPVRTALAGVTLAVTGVVGASVFAASFSDLETTPSRWGWAWSSMPDYFGDGDIAELEALLLGDDRVEAVARLSVDTVVIDDEAVTAYSLELLRGSMALTAVEGRLPTGPDEIALGPATMDDLGLVIGDAIDARRMAGRGLVSLTVVGAVVAPPTDEYELGVGAVLTPDGLAAVGKGDVLSSIVLRYPEGSDVDALETALTDEYGLEFNIFTVANVPGPIRNLAETRNVAVALAVFFAILGVVGLLHALVLSTRRRRGELAVLRAMGLRRRQVRRVITTEAGCLALGGALLGIPLGLVTGRLVWRLLIADIGLVAEPQIPWLLLVTVTPVVAAVAAVVAWGPGRSAVRARPAVHLRSE